jgi:hypothetical protein
VAGGIFRVIPGVRGLPVKIFKSARTAVNAVIPY